MNSLQLKLKKRSQPEIALRVIILLPLFCSFLIDVLSVPTAIKYIIDAMLIFALVLCVLNVAEKRSAIPTDAKVLFWWVIAFLLFTGVTYVVNFQSPFYFIWGVRNNFRFYVFFFACILFFEKSDIEEYLKFFDIFFYFNTAMCFIQFMFFDLKGDFLGGFFGTEKGCNGHLNIFLVIVVAKSIISYLSKKEIFRQCAIKCGLALIVAALAELKFFFVEFIVILLVSVIVSERSFRKFALTFAGVLGVTATATLLGIIFPNFVNFLSLESMLESASSGGYSAVGQLNRLTTVPIISETILTDWPSRIFGLGLGNCDTSNFDFLKTPFSLDYSHLRYTWFSTAFVFLETGFIGLIFFFVFFPAVAWKSLTVAKKKPEEKMYCLMAFVVAVICVMIAIYNSSLRTEAAYLFYFVLSFPFILQKESEMYE